MSAVSVRLLAWLIIIFTNSYFFPLALWIFEDYHGPLFGSNLADEFESVTVHSLLCLPVSVQELLLSNQIIDSVHITIFLFENDFIIFRHSSTPFCPCTWSPRFSKPSRVGFSGERALFRGRRSADVTIRERPSTRRFQSRLLLGTSRFFFVLWSKSMCIRVFAVQVIGGRSVLLYVDCIQIFACIHCKIQIFA